MMTDEGDGFHEGRAEDVTAHPRTAWSHDAGDPAWFPDSRQVAFSSSNGNDPDIWSMNVGTQWPAVQWTTDHRRDFQPTVGPSEVVAFVREMDLGGDRYLFTVTTERPNPRVVTRAVRDPIHPDFSPDGDGLVMAHVTDASSLGLVTMSPDGSHRRAVTIKDMPNATDPDWVAVLTMP
jgi:Tol biopolymer transport system component